MPVIDLAEAWLAQAADGVGTSSAAPQAPSERLALARALKDGGYAALHSDIDRVERALRGLQRLEAAALVQAEAGSADLADVPIVRALRCWLEGAWRVARGECGLALQRLEEAHDAFNALGLAGEAAASQVPRIAALSMLGRHDDAQRCAELALQQLEVAGDEHAAGRVQINLGSMLLRQDRYADAAAHYRRAVVRFARLGDVRHSVLADIGLAGALGWQFEFDESLRIHERAAARARAHGLDMLLGVIDAGRGLLELHRGHHAQALRGLESALREFERHGPPQRLTEARMDLAAAYLELNLLPEAETAYREALAECQRHDMPMEQAWAALQLAQVLAKLGQSDAAQQQASQARELFLPQGNAVGAARADALSAMLALAQGQPAQALAHARAAGEALARAGMHVWRLDAGLLVGQALAALGRHDEAAAALENLLGCTLDLPELRARTLAAEARLRQRVGDSPGALARWDEAAACIEQQRAALPGDDFRMAYGEDRQAPFEALVEAALDGGDARQLLRCMERARAQALALAVAAPTTDAAGHVGDAARWRGPLHMLWQQWQQALAAGDASRATALQARLQALQAEALQDHRRQQAARDATGQSPPARIDLDVDELCGALREDEALVAYAWVGQRLAAVVARSDGLHHQELDARQLPQRLEQLRFQIHALRFSAPALRRHAAQMAQRAQAHLQALHDQLWAPLAAWLHGAAHVRVAPQHALHYLPFAALHDGRHALLDRHALSQVPSAALWLAGRGKPRARPGVRAVVMGVGGLELPQARAEAQAVAEVLGTNATLRLDDAATLAALRDELPGAGLLHLACHAEFRADSPYFSALRLADGPLTLRDAAALPLRGCAVTLSACETGISRIAPGDETLGLVRAFLMAGAPSVLATQWTVDDASTARLMGDFYRAWAAGVPAAEALRQAQIAARARQPHPYFWAPFVLHGQA